MFILILMCGVEILQTATIKMIIYGRYGRIIPYNELRYRYSGAVWNTYQ